MLDRYWFGDVSRISPEAPVPVVLVQRTEERPGGAANVARNITALGGHATLLSVVGEDEAGRTLEDLLLRERVIASLHRDRDLSTTVKLRVIGHQQQLLRIDFERAPSHEVLAAKLDEYERLIDDAHAIVLSDYGKGGLAHVTRMIERAQGPRQAGAGRSQGLTSTRATAAPRCSRPTAPSSARSRAAGATRPTSSAARGSCARELDLDALIVTRSEEGMSLFTGGRGLARAHGGARGLRRERRGRHRDRHAGADGRRGRRPARCDARGEPRRRHRRRQARHAPPRAAPSSLQIAGDANDPHRHRCRRLRRRQPREGAQRARRSPTSSPWTTSRAPRRCPTSSTARSPTTSTSRISSSASATMRSRPVSQAVLHQGACSDTMETDGRYMMENNYRYSLDLLEWCQAQVDPVHLRILGLGVRRRARLPRGARARGAAQRLRLLQVPVRPGGAPPARGAAARRSRASATSTCTDRAKSHKGRMASVAFHFFNQYLKDGQGATLRRQRRLRSRRADPRFRLRRGRGAREPVLPRPSRGSRASSTWARARRRASTTWRMPPINAIRRSRGEPRAGARCACARPAPSSTSRFPRSWSASTRATRRPTSRRCAPRATPSLSCRWPKGVGRYVDGAHRSRGGAAVRACGHRLAALAIAILVAGCAAPQPGPGSADPAREIALRNPGFELDPIAGTNCAPQWGCSAHSDAGSFRYTIDGAGPASGARSLRIERIRNEPWALITQVVNDPKLRGARLRFSLAVRAEGASGNGRRRVLSGSRVGRFHDRACAEAHPGDLRLVAPVGGVRGARGRGALRGGSDPRGSGEALDRRRPPGAPRAANTRQKARIISGFTLCSQFNPGEWGEYEKARNAVCGAARVRRDSRSRRSTSTRPRRSSWKRSTVSAR